MVESEITTTGVVDIGIGVPDLATAVHHWQQFGYQAREEGALARSQCARLYGVATALRAVRMSHGDADRGLIRLMQWDQAGGPGLAMAPLRTPGNRWSVQRTDSLLTALAHAEVLRQQGQPVSVVGPIINARSVIPMREQRPFAATMPIAWNVQIFRPHYQQVLMQRDHIDVSRLGRIAERSLFRASEVCHVAAVIATRSLALFDFYDHVLGFVRTTQRRFEFDPESPASVMFGLEPGEAFTEIDFDDAAAANDSARALSGRLRIFALEPRTPAAPPIDAAPGQLGYSLYAIETNELERLRHKVAASGATQVSPILVDEFARPAFSFRAPDGYFWSASRGTSVSSA